MESWIPDWVNNNYVENVLRKSELDDSIHVCDLSVKPATSKGDNYSSTILRINVTYTRQRQGKHVEERKSMIMKISPQEESVLRDLIITAGAFQTEMSMMSNTLKKMNAILEPGLPLSAQVIYLQAEEPILLILEDLGSCGFQLADRQAGLDLDHSLLMMRNLARFHASSVAICEKEPEQRKLYDGGICNSKYPPEFGRFFIQGTKALANELAQWPEVDPKYSKKVQDISDHVYQLGCEVCNVKDEEFNVITHGDVWVNNMLFRYDKSGRPTSQIFVDFQNCRYASPAIDLLYFLHTSLSIEVYNDQFEVLIEEYVKTLSCTMKQIGCKTEPISLEQLKKTLKEKAFFGMLASFTVLPIVLLDKEEVKGMDEIMKKDGEFNNPAYRGKLYRKAIAARLPMYDEMGLLNLR